MAEVIAGEIGKIGFLYEKYKKPLFAYFFKLTNGDLAASEDLVHTVFYRVIKYKSGFRGKGSFASWLFRIAHNAGIDHNLKINRLNNYKAEVIYSHSVLYEENDLEKEEQRVNLELAMNRLKPEEKELLVLSKIECLRYKEIANILNTTESNVKIKIFRALKKLKDLYFKSETKIHEEAKS
jgi:RNA polymerase sigma factor (sigma-70 family)